MPFIVKQGSPNSQEVWKASGFGQDLKITLGGRVGFASARPDAKSKRTRLSSHVQDRLPRVRQSAEDICVRIMLLWLATGQITPNVTYLVEQRVLSIQLKHCIFFYVCTKFSN